jgi:Kef-type K+ transport system membrane component KefB
LEDLLLWARRRTVNLIRHNICSFELSSSIREIVELLKFVFYIALVWFWFLFGLVCKYIYIYKIHFTDKNDNFPGKQLLLTSCEVVASWLIKYADMTHWAQPCALHSAVCNVLWIGVLCSHGTISIDQSLSWVLNKSDFFGKIGAPYKNCSCPV